MTIISVPSYLLGSQTFAYRETGDVNSTTCWLDHAPVSCSTTGVTLSDLGAGTHRFEVQVLGDHSESSDTAVWTIRAATPRPRRVRAHVAGRHGTVTWASDPGAGSYVVTETTGGVRRAMTSRARRLRLAIPAHGLVTVAIHAVTAGAGPGPTR